MPYRSIFCLLLVLVVSTGCSTNQPVKNTWKGTKNFWYSYVNVPASINYGDTGKMSEHETLFSRAMMGIDVQLLALERTMQNADRPPTPEWLNAFFTQFPWVDGIIGLDNVGGVVGQAGRAIKTFDYAPLFENDPKQNSHALRGHVQEPEVLLAVPLHDGSDFLGLIVVYFEMRSLMYYSDAPEHLIIASPGGMLWTGSSAGTLPGADWGMILRKRTSGTLSDSSGTYQWVSRFLGNYPLVFAAQKTASGKMPKAPQGEPDSPASTDMAPFFDMDDFDLELPPLPEL